MPAYLRRACACEAKGLGALPIAAAAGAQITAFVSSQLDTVLGKLGLSSSDRTRDQERIARVNDQFEKAMRGDTSAEACLRDMAQGVSSGPNDPRQCAVGSTVAAAYAKAAWLEFQARRAAGQAGGALILQSPQAGTAKTWLTYLAIGAGAWFLLRRR